VLIYPEGMDLYELRRLAVQRLIDTRFGGNQAAFSADAGISTSYLSRMLKAEGEKNRKRIGDDMAVRLEETLGLIGGALVNPPAADRRPSKAELRKPPEGGANTDHSSVAFPIHDSKKSGNLDRLASGNANEVGFHRPAKRQVVSLSVMDVEASMGVGNGRFVQEHEDVVTKMGVDENWLRRNATFSSPENLALVTGIGDSMDPTFHDGDPLLVDRGVTDVKVDSIYVLALQEQLYVKRLQRKPDGSLVMLSDNKAYEPHRISKSERDQFRVLGRVVMAWNSRRI
jgi:phage repressor protein C with HTH and peptisase S24 domain